MGCNWSSKSSSTPTTTRSCRSKSKSNNMMYNSIIRVVHLNGNLEVYSEPLTVGQVTEKQPRHFVFPQAQLLSLEPKPLDINTQLQFGNIYFLLPHSVFQSEVSPFDLTSIHRRLTLAAKSNNCSTSSSSPSPSTNTSPVHSASTNTSPSNKKKKKKKDKLSRAKSSPNRYADRWSSSAAGGNRQAGLDMFLNVQNQVIASNQSPCWKPKLESIVENSLTSSESDFQELGNEASL